MVILTIVFTTPALVSQSISIVTTFDFFARPCGRNDLIGLLVVIVFLPFFLFVVFNASQVSETRWIVVLEQGPAQWIVTTSVGFAPLALLMNFAPAGAWITTSLVHPLPAPAVQVSATFRCIPSRVLSLPNTENLFRYAFTEAHAHGGATVSTSEPQTLRAGATPPVPE